MLKLKAWHFLHFSWNQSTTVIQLNLNPMQQNQFSCQIAFKCFYKFVLISQIFLWNRFQMSFRRLCQFHEFSSNKVLQNGFQERVFKAAIWRFIREIDFIWFYKIASISRIFSNYSICKMIFNRVFMHFGEFFRWIAFISLHQFHEYFKSSRP